MAEASPTLRPHIRYQNPYGGHPILRRSGRAAYEAVNEFGFNCAVATTEWHSGTIDLSYTGETYSPDGWEVEPVVEQLKQVLPIPARGFSTYTRADGSDLHVCWPVPDELHSWAVDFSLGCMKAKRRYPDPVSYSCQRHFLLRDPCSDVPMAGQDESFDNSSCIHSDILLHVSSGNTSAFFNLVFPFAEPGPEFVAYVAAIRPYLPIRLAKGNFKHWTLNKAGTAYRIRRVDRSLLDGI